MCCSLGLQRMPQRVSLSEVLGINARCGGEMARLREGEDPRDAEVRPSCPRMRRPG
jgi:hypothetical protein